MTQTEFRPKVRDLLPGYIDDENTGCLVMDGDLCVRPDYQRAFVYGDDKRGLVVDTVRNGMPLGIMYWMKNKDTGKYELMDGQQRTLSLLKYCSGEYSINYRYFHNLSDTEKDRNLPEVRRPFRVQADAGRPYHAVVQGRAHGVRQPADAVQEMQPEEERYLTGQANP